jgi:hypothetical protein
MIASVRPNICIKCSSVTWPTFLTFPIVGLGGGGRGHLHLVSHRRCSCCLHVWSSRDRCQSAGCTWGERDEWRTGEIRKAASAEKSFASCRSNCSKHTGYYIYHLIKH